MKVFILSALLIGLAVAQNFPQRPQRPNFPQPDSQNPWDSPNPNWDTPNQNWDRPSWDRQGPVFENGRRDGRCPLFEGRAIINFAHPFECTKFLQCQLGNTYELECPHDFHWSVEQNVCLPPHEARCFIPDQGPQRPQLPWRRPDTVFENGRRDTRCPLFEGRAIINFAHPFECTKFLQCQLGNTYELECPHDFHWSTEQNVCLPPHEARCFIPDQGPQLPNLPWRRPEQQQPDFIEHSPNLNCPQQDFPGRDVFFPYHLNCANYYQCVNGRAVLLLCPDGLLWDRERDMCADSFRVLRRFDMC